MTASSYDAAVIGAGMLGAATAYRLSRAGLRVVVLDAGAPAGGTTGNSFSWLNAVSKEPEAYHRLNAAGMAEYDRLAAEVPAVEVHRGGCLEWKGDAAEQAELEAKVERLRARGYAARMIGVDELAQLEPGVRPGDASRFAYYERDGWVDGPAVVRALLEQVRAAGGEVRENIGVTAFRSSAGQVTQVETAAGTLAVSAVAVCAGTGTEALVRQLGAVVPVERRPGLLAVTTPVPAGTLSRVVYPPGFHVRPDVSGGLRIGADDVDALTREDTPPGAPPPWASVLLERAAAVLPALAGSRIARVHVGVRPVPADGHTVAGRLPGWDNAYVAVTHSGITLGPLLGRLLAEEVTSGGRDPLLAPFRPERFAVAR